MMKSEPLLSAEAVSVWFERRRVQALDAVTVGFEAGTVTGLVGPNGAGKSTLLKVLAGLLPPDCGRVRIRGTLGWIPDRPQLYRLSGLDWMLALARLRGLRGGEARRTGVALLAEFGLGDSMHRPVAGYSRGMLQRFLIAQALIGDPPVILMDEPSSGLDPFGNDDLMRVFERFRSEGRTVVWTSHQVGEVEAVCDTVVLIDRGRIRAAAPPGWFAARYGSLGEGYRAILRGGDGDFGSGPISSTGGDKETER